MASLTPLIKKHPLLSAIVVSALVAYLLLQLTKVSKASVHYRNGSTAKHCGNCSMFYLNNCTLVRGFISRNAVCDKWAKR